MNLTLSQQPTGHIRVGDSLKLFCNVTIGIRIPLLDSSNINVSVTWTKMSQSSSDLETNTTGSTSCEVTESDGLYMYSSTLMINSLIFSDSARYICTATISPHSSSSNLFNALEQSFTIPVQLSKLINFYRYYYYYCYHTVPTSPNVTLKEINSTTVSISWMQDRQDTYDRFTIFYSYDGPCNINVTNTVNVTAQSNVAEYQHTITGLEEFSNYTLIVYAVNSAGRSLPTASNTVKFRTKPGGKQSNLWWTKLLCFHSSTIWTATITPCRIRQLN